VESDDETLIGDEELGSATPDGDLRSQARSSMSGLEQAPSHDSLDRARSEAAVMGKLFSSVDAAAPKQFGRFVLVERLGAGAMGEVYLAEDTELGRLVALKRILNLAKGDDEVAKRRQQRMVREARALAKIDHPNVVRVYDVQKERGELYISMEYVKGETLKSWLAAQTRSLEAVLEVFVQAGRGLSAAHAVDLVHRDFKPDNALVGEDGRVRVVDFGLARADTDEAADEIDASLEDGSLGFPAFESTGKSGGNSAATDPKLRLRLTRTGAMMGTPAYMAPEQLFRATVDHRSDQFAYCVALHEAVYGVRPFEGNNVYELAEAMMSDRLVSASGPRTVPRWLHEAIMRGLSRDPKARFDSMGDLLAAIDPSVRRARRRNLTLGGAAIVALGAAVVVARLTAPGEAPPPDPCPDASAAIADTWNASRKAALAEHFGAVVAKSYATELHAAVSTQLDGYTERWAVARRRACVATKVEGAYSESVLDLRTRCLERRERELDEVLSRLEAGDERLVSRGPEVLAKLTPVAVCDDIERLESAYAPPTNPADAERVAKVASLLDEAKAASLAAAYDEALSLVSEGNELLGEVSHPPTEADLHFTHGTVLRNLDRQDEAERALLDATSAAERGRHDRAAAAAWMDLVTLTATGKQEHDKAGFYLERAEAAVGRLGDPPDLVARLDRARGNQLIAAGKYDEGTQRLNAARALLTAKSEGNAHRLTVAAIDQELARARWLKGEYLEAAATFERVVPIYEADYGEHHPYVGRVLNNLGSALITGGKSDEAVPHLERALDIRKAAFGENSSKVAQTINALASAYYVQGRCDEALPLYAQAVKMAETTSGPEHPDVANPLANRGRCESRLGDTEAAIESLGRALAIVEKTHGPEHPQVADMLTGLATAEVFSGRLGDGLAHHERALSIRIEAMGEDNAKTAETGVTVADTKRRLGDARGARRSLDRWLPILTAKLGERHPHVAQARTTLGLVELESGDLEAARTAFELADAALGDVETEDRALLDYGYGRVLWDSEPTRARSMLEAVAALDGHLTAPVAERAKDWLAGHPATG